MLLNSI
jgi:Protein tyrosine and serine/threonine kinase